MTRAGEVDTIATLHCDSPRGERPFGVGFAGRAVLSTSSARRTLTGIMALTVLRGNGGLRRPSFLRRVTTVGTPAETIVRGSSQRSSRLPPGMSQPLFTRTSHPDFFAQAPCKQVAQ